jgi:hypothetical protein
VAHTGVAAASRKTTENKVMGRSTLTNLFTQFAPVRMVNG